MFFLPNMTNKKVHRLPVPFPHSTLVQPIIIIENKTCKIDLPTVELLIITVVLLSYLSLHMTKRMFPCSTSQYCPVQCIIMRFWLAIPAPSFFRALPPYHATLTPSVQTHMEILSSLLQGITVAHSCGKC